MQKKHLLQGKRILLKAPTLKDIPAILDFLQRTKEHFAPTDPPYPIGFITKSYWQVIIQKTKDDRDADRAYRYFIFSQEAPDTIIGKANLSQVFRGPFQACYLGYGIEKSHEGQGKMFEATQELIKHAFVDLKLHRIMANYMPTNEKSGALLKRLGFSVEGYARDYLFINGKWRDHILTSLHNPAFK